MVASQFAEAQSHFKHRLVNLAFAPPLRANSTGLFNPIVFPFEFVNSLWNNVYRSLASFAVPHCLVHTISYLLN
jgi:hypothetical protein